MKRIENTWEQIHSTRSWGKYPNEELVRFIGGKFFKIPREERGKIKILEVGCGQGANLWFLAKEGFDVYGMDISPSAIRKAENYLSEAYGLKANLKVADVGGLPYKRGYFDLVIDCTTIQHISFTDHKKAYEEIYRALKHTGIFWSFHIAKGNGYGGFPLSDYYNAHPEAFGDIVCALSDVDMAELLEDSGFEIISLEKHSRSYDNRKKEIVHWGVECEK